MSNAVLALDIGGANLKAAHSSGATATRPFALWKEPARLPDALSSLVSEIPEYDRLAVTMTGELCDCFPNKRVGVHAILDAVEHVAGGSDALVWQTDGRLASMAEARKDPLRAAAANWLALATYCGQQIPNQAGLVVDIGSTTTDITPIIDGRPTPLGRTDPERLRHRELIYTGVRRTPVCSLMGLEGAAELFATSHDLYLVLGMIPEDARDIDTADGRPATRSAALARLARMICADLESCRESDLISLARRLADRQLEGIADGLRTVAVRMGVRPEVVFTAGSGEFLARLSIKRVDLLEGASVFSFAERFGVAVSNAASAYSLMSLATE